MEKKTQREYFVEIIEVMTEVGRTDLADFAKGRIEALDKKSANKKPTKVQQANVGIKTDILAVLTADKGKTATEIFNEVSATNTEVANVQKIVALLRSMVNDDKTVRKVTEKKTSLFFLATDGE